MSIAVIAGLGNPGQKYRKTRHNIGFDVVEDFAKSLAAPWKPVARFEAELAQAEIGPSRYLLVKPLTYMNDSGRALAAILRYYKLEPANLLVIYDDITLELGRAKLRINGSDGGHNGVGDLLARVGPGFARYRIGIGAKPRKEMDLADYVLSPFKPDEMERLKTRFPDYNKHLRLILDKGIEPALNSINQRTATTHERNQNEQL
ncbi:MAG: aminoacyl-tRNA hydrolase [Opitutales bacterium]